MTVLIRATVALIGLLVLSLLVLLLPPVANRFGYARPLPGGLPAQITVEGVRFQRNSGCFSRLRRGKCPWAFSLAISLPPCPTARTLRRLRIWPLGQVGTVPTLLGPAHPVFVRWSGPLSVGNTGGLALVKDGSCYLLYRQVRSR